MVNKETDLWSHIEFLRTKLNPTIVDISNITSDRVMKKVEVGAIKVLVGITVNSILAYGMEGFVITKDEMRALKKMQVQGIKNLFNLHFYVPDVVMLCELEINGDYYIRF